MYSTDDLVVDDDATISGDLTVSGSTFGLYHETTEDGYYHDSYVGGKNLSLFLKNQRADIIRYQPVDNYEYWNGSAWVADSSKEASVEKLLDGRQDTNYSVPARDYKFRFTTNQSSGWPIRANIGIQTSWSGSTFEGCQMLVEHYESGSWVLHATMEFGGSGTSNNSNDNGIDNWGLMFKADSALHDGQGSSADTTRITIDFYGWSPSNSSYTTIPLQNIFITSNYAGTENTDYTNLLDHGRNATFAGNITAGSNSITAGSLDINGNADISGNLTGCAYQGDVIASAYLDSDTAHLTTTQTFTGAKTFTNTVALTGTGRITGIDTVSSGTDAANKTYVDTMLPKAGGTMSGAIAMGNQNITGGGTITGTTLTGTSLDINGNADVSGNLTGLDNVTSTNFIIGGHTINDVDVTSEDSNADDHLMTAKAIVNLIADNENSFLTSSGNTSGTAAIATTITVADESSDTSCNVLFTTAATGNLGPKSGTNLTFNSSSGLLTATAFAGDLTGDVTGTADNATNAQEAATVTATANNSANETVYPTFVDGTSGAQGIETDSGLTYNPSTGMLTSAGFTGALTGNASGSSGSCTGNAATATLAATSTIASDTGSATHFPVFVDGSTGARALKAHSSWNYNPGTSTLTAGKLTTDVAAIVENNKDGGALMTLTGQGAGNEANISLKMVGTSNGNPIKMKMVALDDSGSQVGAGLLSYDAEDDSFGIGQNSSHNRMAIKMENTITSPVDGSTYVYYEPTSIKAREYVASSNSSHYDFNGDIMRNGNDTTVRGKMYVFKNGTWTITNADTKLDSNGLLGMALGTNSTTHGMLLKGTFTLDYDPGGAGNPLYISATDGVASTTVPSTSGHIVRLVGYLIGGTHGNMFFDPDKTYIEVA